MNTNNTKKTDNSQSNNLAPQGIFQFWKHSGETLAVMLRRFREDQGYGEDEKITYAGRLDPMAEGIVPLLVGETRFQKDHLMGASKTYEVDIVLGLSTDTGDLLGILTKMAIEYVAPESIEQVILSLKEIKELPYPEYSSRPVDGKPLFMHARAGKKVAVPIKKVTIYELELKEIKEVPLNSLLYGAIETINKVQGDFRQQEIVQSWTKLLGTSSMVQVVTIVTTVSSGTYMRSLAEKMGELLGVPALAGRIVRTEIKKQ
ncbi:MAG: hypothetical protein ABIO57_01420 [Candidatus Paceibacterota bacterium]